MPGSSTDPRNRIVIGLLWHSVNSGNLGVGALTVANLRLMREVALRAGLEPHFLVLGFVDAGAEAYVTGDDIVVVPLNGRAMLPGGAFPAALSRCDCIVDIGGGDSFTDIYGAKRFAYLWLSKWMALRRNIPLMLAPQTIGPFDRQPQTWLAARVLGRVDCVMARDPASAEAARGLAPGAKVVETIDVAFALPFERPAASTGRPQIGVNVSGLLFNRGYDGTTSFGMEIDYADYTRQLLTALLADERYDVVLVPHVNSDELPVDDDGRVAARLVTEFPGLRCAPRFADPVAAKSFISGLDFLVGGRMHACIAAYSSGVPVLPVAYSRKFLGLFEGVLGYSHVVPVTGLDTAAALVMTLGLIERRSSLRDEIATGQQQVEQKLDIYRAELAKLFGKAIAH